MAGHRVDEWQNGGWWWSKKITQYSTKSFAPFTTTTSRYKSNSRLLVALDRAGNVRSSEARTQLGASAEGHNRGNELKRPKIWHAVADTGIHLELPN